MYSVEVEGLRDRLYATPGLHHKLQEAGVRAGSVFSVTKVEVEGNRKDWKVEAQGQNGHARLTIPKQLNGGVPAANGHQDGHRGEPEGDAGEVQPAPETAEFELLHQTMECCLRVSSGAWEKLGVEVPYTSEDVRAVGITLFLECSRKGIVPVMVAEDGGLPF
jgi:hypothetical protein